MALLMKFKMLFVFPQPEHGDRQRFRHIQHLLGHVLADGDDLLTFVRRMRREVCNVCKNEHQEWVATCTACTRVNEVNDLKDPGGVKTINLSRGPHQWHRLWRHEK